MSEYFLRSAISWHVSEMPAKNNRQPINNAIEPNQEHPAQNPPAWFVFWCFVHNFFLRSSRRESAHHFNLSGLTSAATSSEFQRRSLLVAAGNISAARQRAVRSGQSIRSATFLLRETSESFPARRRGFCAIDFRMFALRNIDGENQNPDRRQTGPNPAAGQINSSHSFV